MVGCLRFDTISQHSVLLLTSFFLTERQIEAGKIMNALELVLQSEQMSAYSLHPPKHVNLFRQYVDFIHIFRRYVHF